MAKTEFSENAGDRFHDLWRTISEPCGKHFGLLEPLGPDPLLAPIFPLGIHMLLLSHFGPALHALRECAKRGLHLWKGRRTY